MAGRVIVIDYSPPPPQVAGTGFVYMIEDGLGIKIGYTAGLPDKRVSDLQTGNPRLLSVIATVSGATEMVEFHLHNEFAEWNVRGEWFDRSQLLSLAREDGGWATMVQRRLPPGKWEVTVFSPYS